MLFRRTKKVGPIKVIGVYRYPADDRLFHDTLKLQYGEDLSAKDMKQAKTQVARHFKNLYLIEITATNPLEELDLSRITQRHPCLPRENWQAPYDEKKLDEQGYHWAFFFHFLTPKKSLLTPFGEISLPKPSELPSHLKSILYEAPLVKVT